MRPKSDSKKKEKVSPIARKVYDATSMIPRGRVSTYGAIARAIEREGASRAVGGILRANPWPIKVPCHRVVHSDGTIGGYGGSEGTPRKIKLLAREGVRVRDGEIHDFKKILFDDFGSLLTKRLV
ncbi:MAG: MGMT family protein [Nitrososphaerales archaeon]